MILHKENLDFKKHCKYLIGEYIQASEDEIRKNDNRARSLDCLYLCPTVNYQGGYEVRHLTTKTVITHHHIMSVALILVIVKQVHNCKT